jgi:hypothetical protein
VNENWVLTHGFTQRDVLIRVMHKNVMFLNFLGMASMLEKIAQSVIVIRDEGLL